MLTVEALISQKWYTTCITTCRKSYPHCRLLPLHWCNKKMFKRTRSLCPMPSETLVRYFYPNISW